MNTISKLRPADQRRICVFIESENVLEPNWRVLGDDDNRELLSQPIKFLDLPDRVLYRLSVGGVKTVGVLWCRGENKLRGLYGVGDEAIRSIRVALADWGLRLRT